MLLEFAHFIQLEEVVVLSGLEIVRVLIVVVAGVQALLLRLELYSILLISLLLLLAKEQVHGDLQLIDFIDCNFCLRCLGLRCPTLLTFRFFCLPSRILLLR